jgi:hypothetical protein
MLSRKYERCAPEFLESGGPLPCGVLLESGEPVPTIMAMPIFIGVRCGVLGDIVIVS